MSSMSMKVDFTMAFHHPVFVRCGELQFSSFSNSTAISCGSRHLEGTRLKKIDLPVVVATWQHVNKMLSNPDLCPSTLVWRVLTNDCCPGFQNRYFLQSYLEMLRACDLGVQKVMCKRRL